MEIFHLKQERKFNECPKCQQKTKFISIGAKNVKGKTPVVWGRYKCSKCDWQSELQELNHNPATVTKPKNTVYLQQHYYKEDKILLISVHTTEKIVDPIKDFSNRTNRHLLTIEVTPQSLTICPNVPFYLESKRIQEGLMFFIDTKDLIASPCAECSSEQKEKCVDNKELCKKVDRNI
jgi:hypothetical protein